MYNEPGINTIIDFFHMHVYVCNLILYLMCMYHVNMIHFLYLENKIVTHLIYCLLNLILYCEHIHI